MNRLYILRSQNGCNTVPSNPITIIDMAATSSLKNCTKAYMTSIGKNRAAPDISICTFVSLPVFVSFSFKWMVASLYTANWKMNGKTAPEVNNRHPNAVSHEIFPSIMGISEKSDGTISIKHWK